MSPDDRIRWAHWIDLYQLEHIGVDSKALWRWVGIEIDDPA